MSPNQLSTASLAITASVLLLGVPLAGAAGMFAPAPTQRLATGAPSFGEAVSLDGTIAAVDSGTEVTLYERQPSRQWTASATIDDHSFPTAFDLDNDTVSMGAPGGDRLDVYAGTTTGWALDQTLTSPVGSDSFGIAADLDGDTLAVGADRDSTIAEDAGAVHIYHHNATSDDWERQAKLVPTGDAADAGFGDNLALNEDTLGVVSPGQESVYVFENVDGTWTQTAKLDVVADGATLAFGESLAVSSATLIVGDRGDRVRDVEDAGAVFVYQRSNNEWTFTQRVTDPVPVPHAAFGTGVALTGNQLVVGAPGDHPPNGEPHCFEVDAIAVKAWNCRAEVARGSVLTYTQTPTGEFHYTQTLTPTDRTNLGSVAANANTVLAGAPYDGDSGAAYLWTGVGTGSMEATP